MDEFSFFHLSELLSDEERFNWHQIVRMSPKSSRNVFLKKLPESL